MRPIMFKQLTVAVGGIAAAIAGEVVAVKPTHTHSLVIITILGEYTWRLCNLKVRTSESGFRLWP